MPPLSRCRRRAINVASPSRLSPNEQVRDQANDEVIELFTPSRCMFSSNWHYSGAQSNSDGADAVDVSMAELFEHFASWVADYSEEDRRRLFGGTADEFYRI